MTTLIDGIILIAAGILGGIANSVAGGASLVTYPAMLAVGLPPIVANASNSFSLIPGNLLGAISDRAQLPSFETSLVLSLATVLFGGAVGAFLLLVTPERFFIAIVPVLIGAATLLFAYGKTIQGAVARSFGNNHGGVRHALLLPAATYGGYFGAGVGVIFMAVLTSTTSWELRRANAVKNLCGLLANGAAIIIFILNGLIRWPETLVMFSGCVIGGLIGGRILSYISVQTLRRVIVITGVVMTFAYAWKFWLA